MHMSDGIVNAATALIFGVVAVAGLAVCVAPPCRRTRHNR